MNVDKLTCCRKPSLQKSVLRLNLLNLRLVSEITFDCIKSFCMFCELRTVIALLQALKKHQHGDKNREIPGIHAEFVENTVV